MERIVEVHRCHEITLTECKKCPSFQAISEMPQGGKNYYCNKETQQQ